MGSFRFWLLGGTAVVLCGSIPTFAQETGVATGGLSDIVVTARKRSESMQKVPVAVSVASADALEQHQIFEAAQLPQLAPSLQVQTVNSQVGAKNFSIRGVGTAVYGPQVESSVAVVIDDVVMSRPSMGVVQFFDLDRVEVLRGPQGMLFGKNASAGLINIVTAKPKIGKTEFLAHATWGKTNSVTSGNEATLEMAGNMPVSSNSALRVSGFVTRQDGFAKNVYRSENLGLTEYGARAKYLVEGDVLQLYVAADIAHEEGPGGSVLIRRFAAPGGVIDTASRADGVIPSKDNGLVSGNARTTNSFDLGGIQATLGYDLGNGYSLSNITAYRSYKDSLQFDTDSTSLSLFDQNQGGRDYWQFSNELRLTSPGTGPFTFQAGLYYLYVNAREFLTQGGNLETLLPAPPAGMSNLGVVLDFRARSKSAAAFAEGQWAITDKVKLMAGGRFTHDELRFYSSRTNPNAFAPLADLGVDNVAVKNDDFSYRLGLQYEVNNQTLAYATYSRGYKGPTFDQVAVTPVDEEIAKSYEIGIKSTLLDNRLRLNLALFRTDFSGYQAQVLAGSTLAYRTVNAGDLRTRGVELEFSALPIDGLTFNGGVTYNRAEYRNFGSVPCYPGQPTGTSGTNVCLPNGSTNVSGNQLVVAPKLTGTLAGRYEAAVSSDATIYVQADGYYRSAFRYTADLDPQMRIGGSVIVGASIGAKLFGDSVDASLFVRNLFDKRIPTWITADPVAGAYGDAAGGGDYWHQFGTTSFRTVGISLNYRM